MGIPIMGVILYDAARSPRAEVQYAPEASAAQKIAGDAAAATYDWGGPADD
jgi:hypothetical protein